MMRVFQRLAQTVFSTLRLEREPTLTPSGLEALESRRLLSGNVTASVAGGSLTVSGDGEANDIVFDQAGLNADQVRVTGTAGTTINAQSEPLILSGITRGVGVQLGAGNDGLAIRDLALPGDVWLETNGGADTVALSDVQVAGTLHVTNESSEMITLAIADTTVDGYLLVSSGSGGHNVALQSVDVQGKTKIGSADAADVITVNHSSLNGEIILYTGGGADAIAIETLGGATGPTTAFNSKAWVRMNDGDDTLQLGLTGQPDNQSVFTYKAKFDGGAGEDTLVNLDASTHTMDGWLRVKDFEQDSSDSEPDDTAPVVNSTNPADEAANVARNQKIAATFSEAMDAATMTDANVSVAVGGVPVSGSVAYVGRTMTFTPTAPLAANTSFTATITTGATDAAGNALAEDFVWNFATGTTSDSAAPTVTSTHPADDATGVALNKKITATFSEEMDPLTVSSDTVTVTGPGGAAVSGTVGYAGDTMTFTPSSPLAPDETYTATITTAAEDLAGNALATDVTWGFTTGTTVDVTAPTVTSTTPGDLATNVALNRAVAATFSEEMDPLTLTGQNVRVAGPGNTAVAGTLNYVIADRTVTFTPSGNFDPDTTYTATIAGGINGVEDSASNALASDEVWTFTTGTQIAQAPIELGRAAPFAVMATASISGTGNNIVGDVGLNPGSAQGIPPSEIDGDIHVTNQTIIDAQTDLLAAYNDAVSRTVTSQTLPGNLGGLTFTPGRHPC